MNIETIRDYALSLGDVTEGFPFGETVLVFKASGKMFLLLPLDEDQLQFNVKCNPERAIELREEYDCVLPGYHMNKKHWNSVSVHTDVEQKLFLELVNHSYDLVFQSLPKKRRDELALG